VETNLPSRRAVLRGALVAVGVVGIGIADVIPAAASATETDHGAYGAFPPVPGMKGDRGANEFWYTYEQRFHYNVTDQIRAAYGAISACTSQGSFATIRADYQKHRANGTWPQGYVQQFAPAKDAFAYLAELQADVQNQFYDNDPIGLAGAFFQFGEGTLYDPRSPVGSKCHLMDDSDNGRPRGFHVWHGIIRATVLLGVKPARWDTICRFNALAWAVQSIQKPTVDSDSNPPVPPVKRAELEAYWLTRSIDQLDDAFDSYPYPPGIS